MNTVTWLHPAPWCQLPGTDLRRSYTNAENTNVAETFRQHSTLDLLDDYDRTDRLGYLATLGDFK
jgi:hypothetical protein